MSVIFDIVCVLVSIACVLHAKRFYEEGYEEGYKDAYEAKEKGQKNMYDEGYRAGLYENVIKHSSKD